MICLNKPVEIDILKRMTRSLKHRGPDDEGYHHEANAGLGHRRLSIIDVATGQQPIYNEKGNLSIVFNGEIYNYKELRKELIKQGHKFQTNSDTETILHLYEEIGPDCLNSLRGMFALAIWNGESQELFLARDRVGKKPLYYASTPHGFLFASEMKAIMVFPDFPRQIDYKSLYYYFSYGYIPAPNTMLEKIKKLEAGHYLIFKKGNIDKARYWDLNYQINSQISEEKAIEKVRHLLDNAVQSRLESEVPLGCLLSGGIDSSANVAFMRKHISRDLHTFTIGFEEEEYNETSNARLISQLFDTKHKELIVKPDAIKILPEIVWHFDEPMFDSSAVATYYVSQMAREHVTVVLTGDGGDESFFGYQRYAPLQEDDFMTQWKKIPSTIRKLLFQPLSRKLFKAYPESFFLQRLFLGNQFSLLSGIELYAHSMKLFHDDIVASLMAGCSFPDDLLLTPPKNLFLETMMEQPQLSYEDQMIRADNSIYLPYDLLVKIDRMSMAHGLEARSPFLDHHLMEFVASLPINIRFKNNNLKYLLKKVLRGIIPDSILDGRKRGFTVPIKKWFRQKKNNMFAKEILLSPRAIDRGIIKPDFTEQLLKQHAMGGRNYHMNIWALLNLEIWFRTFIDRNDITTGSISF